MARALAAALLPWVVLVGLWEVAAWRGWMTTTLFPPPSSFIQFAIDSDFRVGFCLLTLSTVAAVQSVDARLIKTARTFGASRPQVWAWVIFPAVLPQVFTMLRINFFAAWMAVLAAEMVGLKNGVGMIVILGREMFNPNLIMLGICIIGVTGYAVDALLLFIQRKILWWKPAE